MARHGLLLLIMKGLCTLGVWFLDISLLRSLNRLYCLGVVVISILFTLECLLVWDKEPSREFA